MIILLIGSVLAYEALNCSKYYKYYGDELKQKLREDTYDNYHSTLGYKNARKYMYSYIDNNNGSLEGIYSGYSMPCEYGSMSTSCNPEVNCEHIVPQSFFNENDPMKSDLHILKPEKDAVNSARSNYPFDEIDNDEVYKWYKNSTITTQKPSDSENWSKLAKSPHRWEPRDEYKGYVARAVFYFYTMYPEYDISRIGNGKNLLKWNSEFDPTSEEIERNNMVEKYQGNRNPYIDCPELVYNAFEDLWLY